MGSYMVPIGTKYSERTTGNTYILQVYHIPEDRTHPYSEKGLLWAVTGEQRDSQ
jgi:hypothetical protein